MNTRKSLKEWCEENGEYGSSLASQYVGTTESGGHYEITEITYGSKRKVLWRCPKGHEYFAVVGNRTTNHSGCLQCMIDNNICYERKKRVIK